MDAKRILFFIMDLHGGAGVYCRILARALRQSYPEDFHLSLLVLRDRGFLPEDEMVFDSIVKLNAARGGKEIPRQGRGLLQIFGIKRAMDELQPECVIGVGSFADLVAPLLTRVPVILTVHGNYSELMKESSLAWVLEPALRWRFARGLVVAPSRGVAEDLEEHFDAADVRVIAHGVDADYVAELAAAPAADRPNEPYMLAVGRLARQKDYPTMLRSYALARKRGLAVPLVIVGDGPEELALRDMAKELGIAAFVQFLGHRENSFAYMQKADCLVLSSTWEGFGLVLIEAMSLGVPCVSTDCPSGPGEILGGGEYGMLVPVGDSERLAEAMLQMREPETRQRFSELARKRADDFTLQRMAAAYREVLRECAIVR
jgi:glycosyltransferase involved in cell wall biosynthesis